MVFFVIDSNGYRLNVGIILCNQDDKLLWARRVGQNAWQFPQGGIKENETPKQALFRELKEEVGLSPHHVSVIGSTQHWLHYELPKRLIRYNCKPLCIGQKQRWFMLRLNKSDEYIRLNLSNAPEFDFWRWVDYWHPLGEVVSFKRNVYQRALSELAPIILGQNYIMSQNTYKI